MEVLHLCQWDGAEHPYSPYKGPERPRGSHAQGVMLRPERTKMDTKKKCLVIMFCSSVVKFQTSKRTQWKLIYCRSDHFADLLLLDSWQCLWDVIYPPP